MINKTEITRSIETYILKHIKTTILDRQMRVLALLALIIIIDYYYNKKYILMRSYYVIIYCIITNDSL